MSSTAEQDGDSSGHDQAPGWLARSYASAQLVWKLKRYVPTVASTTFHYFTSTNKYHEAWPLSTALFVALAQFSSESSRAQRRMSSSTSSPAAQDGSGATIDVTKEIQKNRKRIEGLVVPKSLPKNGAIFETQFAVERRGLTGILADVDSRENGERVVHAEWSAHDRTFSDEGDKEDKVLLYFHGGAYCLMSPKSHRPLCLQLSKEIDCCVFSVDYRLAPETKFPGALHDAVSAYFYLTKELGIPANQILVGGDSAGGNLATALLLYLRDTSLPPLRGGILLSPWVDFTTSFASWDTNSTTDYIAMDPTDPLVPQPLFVRTEEDLIHPYVSPSIVGSFRSLDRPDQVQGQGQAQGEAGSLPPLIVLAGGAETLRDEIGLFCQRLKRDGVDVDHQIFEGGVHVFVAVMEKGLGKRGIENIGRWSRDRTKFERRSTRQVNKNIDHHERWHDVRNRLREVWDEKQAGLSRVKETTPNHQERLKDDVKVDEERFIYEESYESGPEIKLRATAHPVAVKAFEENSRLPPVEGLTRVIRARRNPNFQAASFLARLHL